MMRISEGFIPMDQRKSPDHIAEEYLMALINRSLVSIAEFRSCGGVKAVDMHDLLRAFCLRTAQDENVVNLIESYFPLYGKHRRISAYTAPLTYSGPFGHQIHSVLGCLWTYLSGLLA